MSGRPCMCNPSERLSRQVSTSLTESQYKLVKEFVGDNDDTMTGLLREALTVYLKSEGVDL